MSVPFMDLKIQYQSIKSEIDDAIAEIIDNTAFIGGKALKEFEAAFSEFCQLDHCIGVGNGTDALYIALRGLGVGPGDEVITAANSFVASSEAIKMAGAQVVFVDCDPRSYCMDIAKLTTSITSKTKAIMPVHLYGQPANMPAIMELAARHALYVVEDAAQAHGAEIGGKRIGTWGDAACFSFYPGKNLGAYGDGGAIVTNDAELARKTRMIANHGRMSKYDHEIEGVNSRLDGLQAAILKVKLEHLEDWTEQRRRVVGSYRDHLADARLELPEEGNDSRHVYHLFVVRCKERDRVREYLADKGVSTGVHYPIGLPFLKAYEHLGHSNEDFPVTAAYQSQLLSLPLFPEMTEDQIAEVCDHLVAVVGAHKGARQSHGVK